jgi:predicted AlkP superfamily pyrophosphatase or phosphodiesterase
MLLCVLLLSLAYPRQSREQVQPLRDTHVIVISVDGLPPEYYLNPSAVGLKVPTLRWLKNGGAYAKGVEGIYPSVTYPAHTTIATGARPAAHGIVQNTIFEPPTQPQTGAWYWHANLLKRETLWTEAKKAGLVTAAVGWPVTVGADIDYLMPEIWDPKEVVITPRLMKENAKPAGMVERATGGRDLKGDELRTTVSEHIIINHKPNVLLIHLVELDGVHHRRGPRTKEAIEAAERQDQYISRIIEATRKAGIFEKSTFMVVSDHGFGEVDKRFSPNVVLVKEKLITLDESGRPASWKAAAWTAGGACAIMLRDPNDTETAKKVAAVFSRFVDKEKSPLWRLVTRRELARIGAVPQAVLVLEASRGYTFGNAYTGDEVQDAGDDYNGTHGYLPTRADMHASLIVFGRAVKVGSSVPLARMIDIGPTAAGLLHIPLSGAEGSPIRELLRPGSVKWIRKSAK